MPSDSSLNLAQRRADLEALSTQELDVLVIGGGITGVGCALDAATRGLNVGLVEQRDLASGTSSRSSKLLHGGLRYLEQRDFALVYEALRERGLHSEKLAPHLVRPVSFLIPLTGRIWQRLYYGAGVMLYEILARIQGGNFPRHRHLTRRGALARVPGLKRSSLIGGIVYHDAQVDDARHTMAVARTAKQHGAKIATSVRVESLVKDNDRVTGVVARDVESDETLTINAKRVVNATGTWIDDIQGMAGPAGLRVHASKGVHIVVPRHCIAGDGGVVVKTSKSVLFIIPWGDFWVLGTTDTTWTLDRAHPTATASDIAYLLDQANRVLEQPLAESDVVGVYAGLRPLIAGDADRDNAKISREHAVVQPVSGLISIAGGKYTTYRVMAADAIDMAAEGLTTTPSSTDEVVIVGAERWDDHYRSAAPALATEFELPVDLVERLLWRHGSHVDDVLALIADNPALGEIFPGGDYLAAEAVYAARHEGALHLEDVLSRRMRVSVEAADRGVGIAANVAALIADELGWDEAAQHREVAAWTNRVAAEQRANDADDDDTAAKYRAEVTDARGLVDFGPAPSH